MRKSLKGESALYTVPLRAAAVALNGELVGHGRLALDDATKVAREVIRTYLKALAHAEKLRSRSNHSVSPGTRAMSKMEVGRHMVVPGVSVNTVRLRMASARRLIANPEARWVASEMPDGSGVRVERIPDGTARAWDFNRNPKARWLADMLPGETMIAPIELFDKTPHPNTKHAARMLLTDMTAAWKGRTVMTRDGPRVKVTRTK